MADSKDEQTSDMKQKFREALERKNQRAKKGVPHEDFTMNVHDSRPDGRKRQFRRKTG
ncbi:DUF5302 domain-containing protein [Streptomyces ovatisporus]|uniref:DUF5302 domain-containing protein n=1 Tax=Streptomyces ovatisporus TaxID=1128682 RepID=A0ABV9ACP1_9ACTN